jgi:hypothetical protein
MDISTNNKTKNDENEENDMNEENNDENDDDKSKKKVVKKTIKRSKKYAPCSQYNGKHIEYKRNNILYCRKNNYNTTLKEKKIRQRNKSRNITKDENGNITKHEKGNIAKDENFKCGTINENQLRDYIDILNISPVNKTNKELCQDFLNLKIEIDTISKTILTTNLYYPTSNEDIKEIAQFLNISLIDTNNNKKDINQLLIDICNLITKHSTKTMKNLLNELFNNKITCSIETGIIITKIIQNILYPEKFEKKSHQIISENLQKKLTLLKKKNILTNDIEEKLLQESLHSKLCHCVKNILIKNKFKKQILNKTEKSNPYEFCLNSIYKNKNFKVPENEIQKCSNDYKWYNELNYINSIYNNNSK